MIPKIIHYCWFGGNPLPESAKKCIASWRKFLPDYEIWQWSEKEQVSSNTNFNPNHNYNDNEKAAIEREQNQTDLSSAEFGQDRPKVNENENEQDLFDKILPFDVNSIPYTQQAYEAKKYAFVSDYARFWILYHYGGLYFDTDVEVIKPLDDIVERGAFMGIEMPSVNGTLPLVNPGVGIGATPQMDFYKTVLDAYAGFHFLNTDGSLNQKTVVSYTTELLESNGMKSVNDIQEVANIWIYPADYFNPLDSLTGKLKLTDNTRSIHWYMNSWSDSSAFRQWLSRMSHRLFGTKLHQLKHKLK